MRKTLLTAAALARHFRVELDLMNAILKVRSDITPTADADGIAVYRQADLPAIRYELTRLAAVSADSEEVPA